MFEEIENCNAGDKDPLSQTLALCVAASAAAIVSVIQQIATSGSLKRLVHKQD